MQNAKCKIGLTLVEKKNPALQNLRNKGDAAAEG